MKVLAFPLLLALVLPLGTPGAWGADEAPWFPEEGAYFGAAVGKQSDPSLPECRSSVAIDGREAFEGPFCIDRKLLIDRVYHLWDTGNSGESWPTNYDRWSRDQGHRLLISWRPKRRDGSIVTWKSIAAGSQDARIDTQAERVKAFGAPIYLSFHAEPEYVGQGGIYGNGADFRAAWRRIVDRFRARRVTNVRWVMVLMGWTFNPSSGRNPLDYYAGSSYVDAVGADAYNWYDCREAIKSSWISFGSAFQAAYNWSVARGKPLVAAEWGTVEDREDPMRKALWLRDAASWIQSHPNMKVVSYFHFDDESAEGGRDCDWTLDTSPAALLAFREISAQAHFRP
ncbi:MAG TPA: glycosyl hydrolase [Actinomycetota bacterium]|nr:glycosyl hydrolase [Actinomycetota bacterium]